MIHLVPHLLATEVVEDDGNEFVAEVFLHPQRGLLIWYFDEDSFFRIHRPDYVVSSPEDRLLKTMFAETAMRSLSEFAASIAFVVTELHVVKVPAQHRWVIENYGRTRSARKRGEFREWLEKEFVRSRTSTTSNRASGENLTHATDRLP